MKDQELFQLAITSRGVHEIFEGFENGDGAAFFERVRHRRQPLDENLIGNNSSGFAKRVVELNK